MKYLSNDGIVFDYEEECCKHEREIEENRKKEQEIKRQRVRTINEKYKELQKLIFDYQKEFRIVQEITFIPVYELEELLDN